MLRWRLLLGAILIAALAGLCWLDVAAARPGVWLVPVALLLAVLASGELLAMIKARGFRPLGWLVIGGNVLIVASNIVPYYWLPAQQPPPGNLAWPLLALVLVVLVGLVAEMHRYEQPGGVVVQLALAVFGLVYVGVLTSFLVQVRMLGQDSRLGMGILLALIATVKLSDIGAYTVGRLWGRNKLAPRLSPGKTIEGALGGLAFACVGSWLAFRWGVPSIAPDSAGPPHAWGWVAFGILVGAAGILGDLAESLIKRDLGCKDSSTWMPGFGGVLDIVDSLLVAAPVAYLCYLAGVVP